MKYSKFQKIPSTGTVTAFPIQHAQVLAQKRFVFIAMISGVTVIIAKVKVLR